MAKDTKAKKVTRIFIVVTGIVGSTTAILLLAYLVGILWILLVATAVMLVLLVVCSAVERLADWAWDYEEEEN